MEGLPLCVSTSCLTRSQTIIKPQHTLLMHTLHARSSCTLLMHASCARSPVPDPLNHQRAGQVLPHLDFWVSSGCISKCFGERNWRSEETCTAQRIQMIWSREYEVFRVNNQEALQQGQTRYRCVIFDSWATPCGVCCCHANISHLGSIKTCLVLWKMKRV